MNQLDEYRVNLKVRNNLLLSAMEKAGYKTVNHFCRVTKLEPVRVGKYVNLQKSPINKYGDWTSYAKKIADSLNVLPEDLWTQEQTYFVLPTNQSNFSISHKELALTLARHTGDMLEEPAPDEGLQQHDRKRVLNEMIDSLTEREAKVLRLRFGLDTKEHSLGEVAEMFGVTNERIRQIELTALRRLRAPERLKELTTVEDPIPKVNFEEIKLAHNKAAGKLMTIQEFDILLGAHDWTYAYADDYNYFKRGESERASIMWQLEKQPEFQQLFDAWSKFSGGSIDKTTFMALRSELLS